MPMAVFFVGCLFGTEHFRFGRLGNMVVIAVGVCIASYGAPLLGVHGPVAAARCCACTPRAAQRAPTPVVAPLQRHPWPAAAAHVRRLFTCTHAASCHPPPAGEINFVPIGVILQMASVATESVRLTLVQILLQVRRGGRQAVGMRGDGGCRGARACG